MRRLIPLLVLGSAVLAACSSIDCPYNNTVYSQYVLMKGGGLKPDTLTDTLTILTTRRDGQDTIIYNKGVKTKSFSLPMSYTRDQDALFLQLKDTLGNVVHDTIKVNKTNTPHFESVDCPMSYFHTITAVSTSHHGIDSIILVNPNVTYDTSSPHFRIYFKSDH